MKSPKTLLFFIILFVSIQICSGQEKSKALLIDQFAGIPCDELLARLDALAISLGNDPGSTGYIVIHPKKDSPSTGIYYYNSIKGHWAIKRYDQTRLVIIQGAEKDVIDVELWNVPPGADKNFYEGEEWSSASLKIQKAFIFDSLYPEDYCDFFDPKYYAEILLSDSRLRGHIVIFNKSRRASQKAARKWLTMMTKDYKVPRNRLRVFFANSSYSLEAEFWIVPTLNK